MNNDKLTFFTSNMSLEQYANTLLIPRNDKATEKLRVGRIMERIKSLSEVVQLKGKNYRNN